MVGLGKPLLDIAEAHLSRGAAVVHVEILAVVLVDDGRIRRKCRLDVEDGRQHLVVDLHLGGCLVCRTLAVGEHGDDGLALPAHLVLGEHMLVLRPNLDEDQDGVEIVRHVVGSEDAHHARMRTRLGEVDAADARMMVRAAHHLHVQHAGKVAVGEERRPAGDMAERVGARLRLADLLQPFLALVGEIFLAQFHRSPLRPR